ncbi:Rep [uncultured virus]|uniref:ATP-dependent helicase Rep n=1 Tax=uncultured virus TaxID=340016 RepID=A0A2K9LW95_9VIRU|nr:Rep [uncultured virus]
MSKCRDYVFTINNPTGWDDAEIEQCAKEATYLIFGKETGEQGTEHYQGFVMFANARSVAAVSRILTRAHLERRRGTVLQATEYCKKDGDFREYGTPPATKRTAKERYKWAIEKAESGDLEAIKDEEPGMYLRHLERFRSLRKRSARIIDGALEHEWWYGPTGTGKSKRLWERHPNHFAKPLNKWWDGYEDENVVGIEEVDPIAGKWLGHFLKIWSDRYPFTAEVKGGTLKKIRPSKVIVTSNYTIEECFPLQQDHAPLKRRFKVTHFDSL